MAGQAAEQGPTGDVSPEDLFFVARLLFQEAALRPAVGGSAAVPDEGSRFETNVMAGAVQAEGQVHVLEIGAEGFGETPACNTASRR